MPHGQIRRRLLEVRDRRNCTEENLTVQHERKPTVRLELTLPHLQGGRFTN